MSAIEEILLPDVGGEAVEIIEICVSNGESFEEEDAIIVVETEKASMDIPASFAGTIENLNVKVGDKVTEGTLICTAKKASGDTPSAPEETPAPTVAKEVEQVSTVVETPNTIEQTISTVIENVYVPDIGGDSDVDVIEVMISVGDHVDFDDGLITLETEKASMDVPAPFAGEVREVFIHAGDKASAGTLIAKIEKQIVTSNKVESASAPTAAPAQAVAPEKKVEAQQVTTSSSALTTKATKVHASPSVRKIAREFGVDLSFVKGSGRKNRILKDDIKAYVKEQLSRPSTSNAAGGLGFDLPTLKEIDFSKFGEIETVELSRIQKISGPALHRNALSMPHVTQFDEADITELEKFRKEQNAIADGFKLSPLVFVVKAVAKALELYPKFNSSLTADGNSLVMKKYFNIAIAVDTPNGLVVPVIKDVNKKGFKEIALDMAEISKKAREGKLKATDMQGASFTISSLGGIGGTYFTPIINAPEVAILGLSKSEMKPKWNGKDFEPALMLPLSLSYDHKVIDGADGARFTTTLAKLLGDIRLLNL
ncbi:MAG: dihydrolipoyllysine-residue acetyltransferase [Arcobacteraceae bacterium]